MSLRINNLAPDSNAQTAPGAIKFHDWIGDGWAILFSQAKDFSPVCKTEFGAMTHLKPKFEKRIGKVSGQSTNPVDNHVPAER